MKDVHKKLNDFFQGSRRKLIICYEKIREPEGNNMEEAIVIEGKVYHLLGFLIRYYKTRRLTLLILESTTQLIFAHLMRRCWMKERSRM